TRAAPSAQRIAATIPRGAGRERISAPDASPSATRTIPSSVLRAGSGPRPSWLARATWAPFVPPVSATMKTAGKARSAIDRRGSIRRPRGVKEAEPPHTGGEAHDREREVGDVAPR